MHDERSPAAHPEVVTYYSAYAEENRLQSALGQLEFTRTCEVLRRELPPPPARVLDVGGAAGAYSSWLADAGYEVHLVDLTPRLVEEARRRDAEAARPIASISVGDARALTHRDGSVQAALLMGPLYHLQRAADRAAAIGEAHRVLAPGGVLAAATISRLSPAVGITAARHLRHPRYAAIVERVLAEGLHVNETGDIDNFTTAFMHRPAELEAELIARGFGGVRVLGVEGPLWAFTDLEERWADPDGRKELLDLASRLEAERDIVAASAHLLGIGRR